MGILAKLFANYNTKQIKKLRKTADKVDVLADRFAAMSDDELRGCTDEYRKRYAEGESLDALLPEAFAAVREASARVLNMRHFYEQIIGGIVLHQGRIAEMKTGEGKTLVATLPAYLNALTGKGMHIVTVNDYLAKRDAEWMGKVYKFMGLSVGVIVHGMNAAEKRAAYFCDIVYATNNELGFDYLRDNMAVRKEDRVLRGLEFAIVDEVDSILIDEARTPLIISGTSGKSSEMYVTANRFSKTLREEDVILEEKEKTVRLSDSGVEKAERFFNIENLGDIENQDTAHYINNALRARFVMKKDGDYIVQDNEIIIVDEFTGRAMIGRRYSNGLHQAIEAKEGVRIRGEEQTLATITFQNFFRLYTKLSGMTGTAKTEESEFNDIYALDVIQVPTHKPVLRIDEPDRLYGNVATKTNAIIRDIEECYAKGQPVLVGTVSVDKSEALSSILKKHKVPHNVLNAKNHAAEAEIIAQAGKKGAVTIATNMAGRGTDIVLGGNPEYLAKQKMENLGYSQEMISKATSFAHLTDEEEIKARSEYEKYYELFKKDTDAERELVTAAGGLRIIGTERHESRRIDNQLRGRSGRQGDPGSSVFYISLEDDMFRIFGETRLKSIFESLATNDELEVRSKIISKLIENTQSKVEDRNFSIRKSVLRYDGVMNVQRSSIYEERNKVLDGIDVHEQIISMMETVVDDLMFSYVDYGVDYYGWDYDKINEAFEQKLLNEGTGLATKELAGKHGIREALVKEAARQYNEKAEQINAAGINFAEIERTVMLRNVDIKWMNHIENMDRLKEGIGLQAYAQKDPALAYQKEGMAMFDEMIEDIHRDTVTTLFKAKIDSGVERREVAKETSTNDSKTEQVVRKDKKVGRNEPCPCGSGKKYKNCCGKEQ